MKYKKIHSISLYNEYCDIHEKLMRENHEVFRDEIELLEVLIEDYDRRMNTEKMSKLNPVELLKTLIHNASISQNELAQDLGISRQLLSDILNYRRNISKNLVIKLADHFAMSQEAFSRTYDLRPSPKKGKSLSLD